MSQIRIGKGRANRDSEIKGEIIKKTKGNQFILK